jgi:hypothetical protein
MVWKPQLEDTMQKHPNFLVKFGKRGLLPLLFCLCFLVFPGLAEATNPRALTGNFLSTSAEGSQATHTVQFEVNYWGTIDKIIMEFPEGTKVDKAVLGMVRINDHASFDDGKGRDDNKLLREPDKNTLVVDLSHSRHIRPGTTFLIEIFNLTNPPANKVDEPHVLNITIQDKWGKERLSIPITFSTLAGTGDITEVKPGTGLAGGGTSGAVTLFLDQVFTDALYINASGDTVAGDLVVGGSLTAGKFSGDGSGLTNVTAANLSPGLYNISILGNSGSANSAGSATSFTGALAGDVTGTQGATRVVGIQNVPVLATTPTSGQVLKFDGANWAPGTDNTGGGSVQNIIISSCIGPTFECNTAIGVGAFGANTSGTFNTAVGSSVLASNDTGFSNSGVGSSALISNTSGSANSAFGVQALAFNTTGHNNAAYGSSALFSNDSGSNNTALGVQALESNFTGSGNVAVGFQAGVNANGSNNIYLGNSGVPDESNTMRIGTSSTHTRTFIAGIRGMTTGQPNAIPVLIDPDGQLGTVSSSRRYKEDIRDMGAASSDLLRLRPVTFRYKQAAVAGERPREYGLIAEEVAEVYPDLVVHSAAGEIETVQYHKLVPMLLNELQKQHQQLGKQEEEITQLKARLAALEKLLPAKERLAQW